MSVSREFEVRVEPGRNLLCVCFLGHVTPSGMKQCCAEVERTLQKFHPGFTVLTDLTRLESMALDCVGPLSRMMDRFRTSGVATVVRVIPDPAKDIGFNILALTHYRRGIHVVTCATAEEAEGRLPQPRPAGDTAASPT